MVTHIDKPFESTKLIPNASKDVDVKREIR
jgi:hypothetical protein